MTFVTESAHFMANVTYIGRFYSLSPEVAKMHLQNVC